MTQRKQFNGVYLRSLLISAMIVFMFIACASSPKEFDPDVSGPQMIVEPDTIRLGVARVMGTTIVFKGKGFQPEDSVFIKIVGVKKKDQVVDVPVADGDIDKKGYFTATMGTVVKVSEILRAELGSNEKMENVIIIKEPPIPKGAYTAKAVSMESDITAECKLVVKGPSVVDRIKDWLGKMMGKIEKK